MNLINIIKTSLLVLDIFVLFALICHLLSGFLAGWRKKLINLISFLIPFIILLLLLNPISKAMLNVNIGGMSIVEYIISSTANEQFTFSQESVDLLTALITAGLKQVVYYSGLIICAIFTLINKLILSAILKNFIRKDLEVPNDKKSKVKKSARFIGMGIAFVNFLIVFVIVYFPIFGYINLADVTINEIKYLENTPGTVETVSSENEIAYEDIQLALNSSKTYQITKLGADKNTGITIPAKYLGQIMSVKTDKTTTNLVKEVVLVIPLVPIAYDIMNDVQNNNKVDFSKLSQNDLDRINSFLSNTTLIYQFSPLIKDAIIMSLESAKDENGNSTISDEIITIIKDLDIDKEIKTILEVLKIAINDCSDLVLDLDHMESALEYENLPNAVNNVIDKLLESRLVSEIFIPKLTDQLKESLPEELSGLKETLTTKTLIDTLKYDVKKILIAYQDLAKNTNIQDVIKNSAKLDLSSDQSVKALSRTLTVALELKIIEGNESSLMEWGLKMLNDSSFNYDVLMNGIVPDWPSEKENIVKILEEGLYLYNNHIKSAMDSGTPMFESLLKKDDNDEYVFKPLLNAISDSTLFVGVLVNFFDANINELLGDSIPAEIKELFDFTCLKTLSKEEFTQEVERFIAIFDLFVEMNVVDSTEPLNITPENISSLLNNIFSLRLITGKETQILDYIVDFTGLQQALDEMGIVLNYEEIDWNTEPQKLANVFNAVLDFGDIENLDFGSLLDERNEENKTKLVNLLTALGDSSIFSSAIYPIIEKGIASTGYEIVITDDDKAKIKENGWASEINVIFSIIDECQEFLNSSESYQNIAGEKVAEIMILASDSVIASKIVGGILEEMLGPDNLNIMPKNADGTNKYDFTQQSTLKEVANSIASLIDLNRNISNFDINNADDNIISSVSNVLNQVQENSLAKDMIAEYLEIETTDIDAIDFSQEATTIENVYEQYSQDPENFDISSHPELVEELNNSEVAQSILELLGII